MYGAIIADLQLTPGHFENVGVSKAGEAGKEKRFFYMVLRSVWGVDYLLDFLDGKIAAGVLFGARLEFRVGLSAGVLDDDAFPFGFVESYHDSGKQCFFVYAAEGTGLVVFITFLFVEIVLVVVEVVDEAEEVFSIDAVEGDIVPLICYEATDCAAHKDAAGGLAVFLIGVGHLLQIHDEVILACPPVVFESELSVEQLLHAVYSCSLGKL